MFDFSSNVVKGLFFHKYLRLHQISPGPLFLIDHSASHPHLPYVIQNKTVQNWKIWVKNLSNLRCFPVMIIFLWNTQSFSTAVWPMYFCIVPVFFAGSLSLGLLCQLGGPAMVGTHAHLLIIEKVVLEELKLLQPWKWYLPNFVSS